jgi:hypothetical protein
MSMREPRHAEGSAPVTVTVLAASRDRSRCDAARPPASRRRASYRATGGHDAVARIRKIIHDQHHRHRPGPRGAYECKRIAAGAPRRRASCQFHERALRTTASTRGKTGRGGYPPQDARPPRPRGGRMPPGRRAPTAHTSPYLACGASAVHGVMRCGGRGAEIDS